MRVVILYHPKSEQAGTAQDYVREYHARHEDHDIELLSLETKDGADMAQLYDVVRYPAILAIANDGQLLQLWQEEQLPLMNELDTYFQ